MFVALRWWIQSLNIYKILTAVANHFKNKREDHHIICDTFKKVLGPKKYENCYIVDFHSNL